MTLRVTLIPCIAAVWYFSACDGSGTGPAVPATKGDITATLTGSQWLRAGLTIYPGFDVNDDGRVVTDLFAEEEPCDHDDILSFSANGTWNSDEGPTKCDASDPQSGTGTWELNATLDSIAMTDDDQPGRQIARIAALNSATFSVQAVSADWPDSKARTQTFTWKAK